MGGISTAAFKAVERRVDDHDLFINGSNGKQDGAASRLILLEDNLKDIKNLLHLILGILGTILAGVAIWFFTTILPKILAEVSGGMPQFMAMLGMR